MATKAQLEEQLAQAKHDAYMAGVNKEAAERELDQAVQARNVAREKEVEAINKLQMIQEIKDQEIFWLRSMLANLTGAERPARQVGVVPDQYRY